ncbi:MAG TPA: cytochrome c [Candidatus Sulfopaludibacter sp.]|nr:cytochrome c [Candidatus Sulfopaludibacter sp.]
MKLNLFLLAVLVALVAANFGLSDNPTHRNFEAMPEMVRTIAYKSFSANPNFADGKTLQLPPEGTVPRELAHQIARPGAVVFQIYCQPCHGGAGKGDGPVAMRGFPPPPSLLAEHALHLTGDQMFQIVSRGQKNMPSYAVQVPPQDRRAVIAYIRSLQGGAQP